MSRGVRADVALFVGLLAFACVTSLPAVHAQASSQSCSLTSQVVGKVAVIASGRTYYIATLKNGKTAYITATGAPVTDPQLVREIGVIDFVHQNDSPHGIFGIDTLRLRAQNNQDSFHTHLKLRELNFIENELGDAAATAVHLFATQGESLPSDLRFDAADAISQTLANPNVLASVLMYGDYHAADAEFALMERQVGKGIDSYVAARTFMQEAALADEDTAGAAALFKVSDVTDETTWSYIGHLVQSWGTKFADIFNPTAKVGKYTLAAGSLLKVNTALKKAMAVPMFVDYLKARNAAARMDEMSLPGSPSYALPGDARYTLSLASPACTPVSVTSTTSTLRHIVAIAAGPADGYALDSDGTVWSWGADADDELGYNFSFPMTGPNFNPIPHMVSNVTDATAIAAGDSSAYALTASGTVWAWGDNSFGQMGIGTQSYDPTVMPVQVTGLPKIVAIAAGGTSAYALASDGTVWAWGDGGDGQMGTGSLTQYNSVPIEVPGISDVTAIAAAGNAAFALEGDGTVLEWGVDTYYSPTQVTGISNVKAIAAGGSTGYQATDGGTGYAITTDGSLWEWNFAWNPQPQQVAGVSNVSGVSDGIGADFALETDGDVYGWGSNYNGQLGDGSWTQTTDSPPTRVVGLKLVTGIAASQDDGYALESDGTVWAWGVNDAGQLGNDTVVSSDVPMQVHFPAVGH